MRELCQRLHVDYPKQRIGRRLKIKERESLLNFGVETVHFVAAKVNYLNAQPREKLVNKLECPPVRLAHGNDTAVSIEERQNRGSNCCHARTECDRLIITFHRRKRLFGLSDRWIVPARIDEPTAVLNSVDKLVGAFKLVRGRQIHRGDHGFAFHRLLSSFTARFQALRDTRACNHCILLAAGINSLSRFAMGVASPRNTAAIVLHEIIKRGERWLWSLK